MDPVSFALAAASVTSILQTCLHGYRALNVALATSDCSLTLSVRFRLEECRLYLWGRNWGLTDQMEDMTSIRRKQGLSQDDSSGFSIRSEPKPNQTPSLDNVDALLEIPGLKNLVMDILARIHDILEKWNRTMDKYAAPSAVGGHTSSQPLSIAAISKQQQSQIKDQNKSTSFAAKLRWAVKDKGQLDELLTSLIGFNDGLESLLPRTEKESVMRALAGEFLSTTTSNDRRSLTAATDIILAVGKDEVKAARILSIREHNFTEKSEFSQSDFDKDDASDNGDVVETELREDVLRSSAPFSKTATEMKSSWEIPSSDFQHFVEPQLDYDHLRTVRVDNCGPDYYVPLPRSFCIYRLVDRSTKHHDEGDPKHDDITSDESSGEHNSRRATNIPVSTQNQSTQVPESEITISDTSEPSATMKKEESPRTSIVVLIEWRLQRAESARSDISEQELAARREHVVSLLHRTSVADEDFCVLDCLGFTLSAGFTADGDKFPLVGFVYRYPSIASPNVLPTTLRSLLDDEYNSNVSQTPSLEHRAQLAKALTISLYQLQCAGWIHRKISSYNILFFPDRETGKTDITRPYLSGWQYSRPDDQWERKTSERGGFGIGDFDMYVHPARLESKGGPFSFPRFRRSFDIYSMGVVLLEIAFWEPILALGSDEDQEKVKNSGTCDSGKRARDWQARYIEVTRQEMAAEMGSTYRDVVLKCLKGLVPEVPYFRRSTEISHFEEPGLEKDFFWNVVRPLGRLKMC